MSTEAEEREVYLQFFCQVPAKIYLKPVSQSSFILKCLIGSSVNFQLGVELIGHLAGICITLFF